jgi:hypothetical protein
VRNERVGNRRVQGHACTASHGLDDDGLVAVVEGDRVHGHARDPGRQRDVLSADPAGGTTALPPFGGVVQGLLDPLAESEAPRGHAGHLAAPGVERLAEGLAPGDHVARHPCLPDATLRARGRR